MSATKFTQSLEGGKLAGYKEKSLHKSFEYKPYVWGWSWRFAFGCGVGVGAFSFTALSLMLWKASYFDGRVMPEAAQREAAIISLAAFLFAAGVGFTFGLWNRVRSFDDLMDKIESNYDFRGPEYPQVTGREGQAAALLNGQQPILKVRPPKTLAYRGVQFHFAGSNLDTMLSWVRADMTSIRKVSGGGMPGFDSLPEKIVSNNYTNAVLVLEAHNMIVKIGQQYVWTDRGVAWLKQE